MVELIDEEQARAEDHQRRAYCIVELFLLKIDTINSMEGHGIAMRNERCI